MPRPLATGPYTEEQVKAQLRARTGRIDRKFEVLDNANNYLGFDLDSVKAEKGASIVEFNGDRPVKGSLTLKMFPDERMRRQLYRKRIRPWFGQEMTLVDGGWAWWPFGIYLWPDAAIKLSAVGVEEWNIVCLDQGQILNETGPRLTGFTGYNGEFLTDIIERLLQTAGFSDVSGVVHHTFQATISYTWSHAMPWTLPYIVRAAIETTMREQNVDQAIQSQVMSFVKIVAPDFSNAPATWLRILELLMGFIGYHPPHFDLDGRFIARPATDLPAELTAVLPGDLVEAYELLTTPAGGAQLHYSTDDLTTVPMIRDSHDFDHDLQGLANHIMGKTQVNDIPLGFELKAEDLAPGHPVSEPVIGRYITQWFEDTATGDPNLVLLKAIIELVQSMSMFQTAQYRSLVNPAHTAFELVGLQYAEHEDFETPQLCQEPMWAVDLYTGEMDHGQRRLWQSPTG